MSFYVRPPARNDFTPGALPRRMSLAGPVAALPFGVDPVLVGIITVLLLVVFALFLFLRKTLVSFSEGIREGKRR